MNIDTLVFQGGGAKGISYIGALEAIDSMDKENSNYIQKNIKRVAGTSAGAITAFLIAAGYSSSEIREQLYPLNFDDLFEHPVSDFFEIIKNSPPVESLKKIIEIFWVIFKSGGYNTGDKFKLFMGELLKKKGFAPGITFEHLQKKTGISLHVYSLDVAANKLIEFSAENENTSSTSVVDAIRASMSLPLVFTPVKLQTEDGTPYDVYTDGGLIKNYPIDFSAEHIKNTVGFVFGQNKRTEPTKELSLFELLLDEAEDYLFSQDVLNYADPKYVDRTVFIDNLNINTLSFDMSQEDKDDAIAKAKQATLDWISQQK